MSRAGEQVDRVEAGALALQRVLALEGRNALARVELAASELVQLEASPAARERLAAIRAAVDELDDVLDKIERLSDPLRDEPSGARSRLTPVWASLVERIAPVLAARGLALTAKGEWADPTLALPVSVLERLLLAFLRVVIAALEAEDAEEDGESSGLSIECVDTPSAVLLFAVAEPARAHRRLELERADRVELEVALAQWRSELVDETGGMPSRIGLRMRKVTADV